MHSIRVGLKIELQDSEWSVMPRVGDEGAKQRMHQVQELWNRLNSVVLGVRLSAMPEAEE